MSRLILILTLYSCAGVSLATRYEGELTACVELSNTREEYNDCKRAVQKRYEKDWDNNAVD